MAESDSLKPELSMKVLVDLYEQALRANDSAAISAAKGAIEHAAHAEASIIHMNAAEALAQVHLRVAASRG